MRGVRPPTPTRGLPRRLRGGSVGLLTGLLAAAAHIGATGRFPDWGLVLLLVVILGWVAGALASRERGPAEILGLVSGGQLAMHGALTLVDWEPHSHHHGSPVNTPLMVAGHTAATLVVVAVLAGAERVVFALVKLVASVLPRRLVPWPATSPLSIRVALEMAYPATEALLRDVLSRRGPPVVQA